MIQEKIGRYTTIQNPRLKTAANAEIYSLREHLRKYLQLRNWQKRIINEAVNDLWQLNGGAK